jgi:hypothetical protein
MPTAVWWVFSIARMPSCFWTTLFIAKQRDTGFLGIDFTALVGDSSPEPDNAK